MKRSKAKQRADGTSKKRTKLVNHSRRLNKNDVKQLDMAWSEAVRKRDVVCVRCGSCSRLQAHHVFGRGNRATRWVVENGVTLCYPCHMWWAHRDIGGFCSFWQKKYGMPLWETLEAKSKEVFQPTKEDFTKIMSKLKEG